MASDNVFDRLHASVALASLRQAQHVAQLLRDADWRVTHGYYYQDHATDKYRELDVAARRFWSKRGKNRNLSVGVEILCEIKSIRDFHIIFAANSGDHYFADDIR